MQLIYPCVIRSPPPPESSFSNPSTFKQVTDPQSSETGAGKCSIYKAFFKR